MNELFDFLIKKEVEYKRNKSMAEHTSVRIGGVATVIVFPNTEQKLVSLVRFLTSGGIKYRIVGRMTNILPCDGEYTGVLVSTRKLSSFKREGCIVKAGCGLLFSSLICRLAAQGLGGAEALCGIPGTLGGMITSNAGAYGREIGDLINAVATYSPSSDTFSTYTNEDCRFSYRDSVFKRSDEIILSADIQFVRRPVKIIVEELGKIKRRRIDTQPVDCPSLGSVFKRVGDTSAAQIIDRCGLKGTRIGDAVVSPKHAGFVVNTGNATAADYRALVELIKKEVYLKCGVILEEEIEYL